MSGPDKPAAVRPPVPVAAPKVTAAKPVEPALDLYSTSRRAKPLTAGEEHALKPKDSFTECDDCPEMVPGGEFMMGSPADEIRFDNDRPAVRRW